MAVLEEMEEGEVEEQASHGLDGLIIVFLAALEDVLRGVSESPVLEAPCYILEK
jgi:hypothetical protein